MFVGYTIQYCDEPPAPEPNGDTETAFAFGDELALCFLDIDEDNDGNGDFNRWGWTNGAITAGLPGFWEWEIYAGAGQCDLSKGTLVGTLSVLYSTSGHFEATYSMDTGFGLEETHLYVGIEILQQDGSGDFTVAPGQYDNIHEELWEIQKTPSS